MDKAPECPKCRRAVMSRHAPRCSFCGEALNFSETAAPAQPTRAAEAAPAPHGTTSADAVPGTARIPLPPSPPQRVRTPEEEEEFKMKVYLSSVRAMDGALFTRRDDSAQAVRAADELADLFTVHRARATRVCACGRPAEMTLRYRWKMDVTTKRGVGLRVGMTLALLMIYTRSSIQGTIHSHHPHCATCGPSRLQAAALAAQLGFGGALCVIGGFVALPVMVAMGVTGGEWIAWTAAGAGVLMLIVSARLRQQARSGLPVPKLFTLTSVTRAEG